jgi:hypothetical protein
MESFNVLFRTLVGQTGRLVRWALHKKSKLQGCEQESSNAESVAMSAQAGSPRGQPAWGGSVCFETLGAKMPGDCAQP